MVKKFSDLVNTALNKCSISLEDENDPPTWKKKLTKLKEVQNLLKNYKNLIYLKVLNISIKLFKALIVYRLQYPKAFPSVNQL